MQPFFSRNSIKTAKSHKLQQIKLLKSLPNLLNPINFPKAHILQPHKLSSLANHFICYINPKILILTKYTQILETSKDRANESQTNPPR